MRKTSCLILLGMVLLTACHNRVQFPSQFPSKKKVEHTTSFFLWGVIGETNYELYEDCPTENVYEVHTYTSPLQVAWNLVTLGIYSPRTVEVTCSGKGYTPDSESMEKEKKMEMMEEKPVRKSKSPDMPPAQKMPMRPKPFDLN